MIPTAPLNVRMGEIVVSSDADAVLSVIGIGSCLALAVFSPEQQIGGVAHVVLPDSAMAIARTEFQGRFVEPPAGKFADTAVPALVEELRKLGAKTLTMRAVLVGGAAMFGSKPNSLIASVGRRNIEAVTAAVGQEGLRLSTADVGGTQGRSLFLQVGPGVVITRVAGDQPSELYPGNCSQQARFVPLHAA